MKNWDDDDFEELEGPVPEWHNALVYGAAICLIGGLIIFGQALGWL